MTKFYLILLLTLIINLPVLAQGSGYEIQFKLGNERLNQKDYDGAIVAFSECLRLAPQTAGCYGNRGIAYRHKSNYKQSIADFTEAIKLAPKTALYYNGRAIAYRFLKKYELAIADLNTSLKINPNDSNVRELLNAIKVYAEKSDRLMTQQALLGGVISANTGFTPGDFFERGKELVEKNDNSTAILYFSECLRLKSDFADCYHYRGRMYHRDKQYEKAVADYSEALKLQPQNVEYYRDRAYANGDGLKKYDAAIADLNEVIKLEPKSPWHYVNRAYVHKSKKDYQKAAEDFTSAINVEPTPALKKTFYGMRSDVYFDNLNNYQASIADQTEIIKIAPQDWVGYSNRGRAYLKNKNYEKAIADYTKVIEIFPHGFVYVNRGKAYCALGKKTLALADKKKAQELGEKEVDLVCQPAR